MGSAVNEPDDLDRANAEFWRKRTLEEMLAHVKPMESWADLDIPDLTDAEREAFATALDDA